MDHRSRRGAPVTTERIRRVEDEVAGGGAFLQGSPTYEDSEFDRTGYTRALERGHGSVLPAQFRETVDADGRHTEQTPWLRVAPGPPHPGEPPRVVLAVLTLDNNGAVLAAGATVGDRAGPMTPVAAVEVRTAVSSSTAT